MMNAIPWKDVAIVVNVVIGVLVALGLKEAGAALLRRLGLQAVVDARRTPDKGDDARAALLRDAFFAIARKLDGGAGEEAVHEAAALAELAHTAGGKKSPTADAALRRALDKVGP